MNRSYWHSQKSKSVDLSIVTKYTKRNPSGFRTLWKFRDTHQTYIPNKTISVIKKPMKTQPLEQARVKIDKGSIHEEQSGITKQSQKNYETTAKYTRVNVKAQQERNIYSCHEGKVANRENGKNDGESPDLSIEELEKKIQELIRLKLGKKYPSKMSQKSKQFSDELESELTELTEQVKNFVNKKKEEVNSNQTNTEIQLSEINKKIGLLQKIIAGSFTESEIHKKYYSSGCKLRKQYAVLDSNFTKQLERSIPRNLSHSTLSSSGIFLHHQSASMSSFTKPPPSSYINVRGKEKYFVPNRQPMPRSTYQREYLQFGNVPHWSICRFGQNITENPLKIIQCINRPEKKQSNYTSTYTKKKIDIIDSKLLDCRRDKFKNIDMSFIPVKVSGQKKQNKENTTGTDIVGDLKLRKKTKAQKFEPENLPSNPNSPNHNGEFMNSTKMSSSSILFTVHYPSEHLNYKTEHASQFQGSQTVGKSVIKDQNLNQLKYLYKRQYLA